MTEININAANAPKELQKELREFVDNLNRNHLIDRYVQNPNVKSIAIEFGSPKTKDVDGKARDATASTNKTRDPFNPTITIDKRVSVVDGEWTITVDDENGQPI